MVNDTTMTADVLGTERGESWVSGEDSRVHDSGPGVTPGGTGCTDEASGIADSETEPERIAPSEVITEIAPETKPSEVITEIAPEIKPSEVITEIAPEVGPSETEPERYDPSEVITEVAPEVAPSETEPERFAPSEVITEIAPERDQEISSSVR